MMGRRSPRARFATTLVALTLWGAACGSDDDGSTDGRGGSEGSTSSVVSSTSTAPTTSARVPTPLPTPSVRTERVLEIDEPVALVDHGEPGAEVLVATQDGRVHLVDLDGGDRVAVMDLSDRVSDGREQGLLGMALSPDRGRLYVNYTNRDGDTEVRSFPMSALRGEGRLHLEFDQPFSNHNGGHLAFDGSGDLWIGTGDGGSGGDPDDNAQDPDSLLGKMLRVVPLADGGVRPSDANDAPGDRPEVWGVGLRNPWRYSFDRLTGDLWVADVGQGDVEEVTVVDPGATDVNFGWDDLEGDAPFEGSDDPGFVAPVITYTHEEGCSVTGGYVYRGVDVAALYGWYVFADYCGGWIRAVVADDPSSGMVELLEDVGPVRSFAELGDGELLVLVDDGILALRDAA